MVQRVAVQAGRCLRIPPRGEQKAAEEDEDAGAYLNVVLPERLACDAATHGPVSVCEARAQAQVAVTSLLTTAFP